MIKVLENIEETDELTKSEINSKWILDRIHKHDEDSGGMLSVITGSQGSAKTSVLLSFAEYTMRNYPNEKLFWSNTFDAPLQSNRLPMKKSIFLCEEGVNFFDRAQHMSNITSDVDVKYFKSLSDLYHQAKPGKLNVVFFKDRTKWMEFIHFLRDVGEWSHVYIDEFSELAPANSAQLYRRIENFSVDLKECRKCLLNIHTTTQSVQDIDYRVSSKVMLFIYLPGAKKYKWGRVTQDAIDNLKLDEVNGNESYLEYSGRFGKTIFRDIYKPGKNKWEVKYNGRDKEDKGVSEEIHT